MKYLLLAAIICVTLCGCTPQQVQFFLAHYHADTSQISSTTISPQGLAALRECESHDNYRAISKSGRFRGAYQFSRTTWNNVTRARLWAYYRMDPVMAPAPVQDAAARILWGMTGPVSWPVCGRRT